MKITPIELAGCVITNDANEVLLIHRNTPDLKQWELPGGKVEPNETLKQAAQRECLEELGIKVGNLALIGDTEFGEYHYSWFYAKIAEGEPKIMEPHIHDAFGYVDINNPDRNDLRLSANAYDLGKDLQSGRIKMQNL
jgi:8-oxo-dGTP diphosphatase